MKILLCRCLLDLHLPDSHSGFVNEPLLLVISLFFLVGGGEVDNSLIFSDDQNMRTVQRRGTIYF